MRFDLIILLNELKVDLSRADKYYQNSERRRIQHANKHFEESFERHEGDFKMFTILTFLWMVKAFMLKYKLSWINDKNRKFCEPIFGRNISNKYMKCCNDDKMFLPTLSICPELMK